MKKTDVTRRRGQIIDPIYKAEFLIVTGPDRKKACKLFCKWADLPFADFAAEFENSLKGGHAGASLIVHTAMRGGCLWFYDHKPSGSIVAHEVTHATCLVMEYLGATRLSMDDEVMAYYAQFLTSRIGKMLW